MLTIYIDNKPYEVKEGENVLSACLSLGFDIPYFCWHPALHSVGACRVCAVKSFKDEKDTKGRLIMSCTTPAEDGMRISIDDPEAREFRASVIELLMINHPHDCPVCDEGGECHLQDMTLMTGHNYRRYRFTKRTHRNQRLGPFVNHEMNRCIQCYRCVRYYRDYAGGRDLDVLGTHDHVYFGRYEDGKLESEFSGNLAEVCPTGVFTDATLKKHYTRKWDLQSAPSVCVHCGLGCNTIAGERYGSLRCIRNRYNGDVNGYFLCDRGRFGYGFINGETRLRRVYARSGSMRTLRPIGLDEASGRLKEVLHFGERVIGVGSPRASVEANYALRTLVGPENFFAGFSAVEHGLIREMLDILDRSHVLIPTLAEAEKCDAVFVLGEDATNTAPRLALALRQTVIQKPYREAAKIGIPFWEDKAKRAFIQDEKGPFFVASLCPTRLDGIATETYHAPPADLARLGFAVARAIDPSAPEVRDLRKTDAALAERIAGALKEAERPLVVSGTGALSAAVMRAAQSVAIALKRAGRESSLFLVAPECNSLGLGLMAERGLEDALEVVRKGGVDAALVLENDLFRRLDRGVFESFCGSFRHLVVLDHIMTETASRASLVLPAATFAEADGTFVNAEGRAQTSYRALLPEGDVEESWKWLRNMMSLSGHHLLERVKSRDDIIRSLRSDIAGFAGIEEAAPGSGFRVSGLKIPRQPHRYSGRTSMTADISVHEPQAPRDADSPLAFTMEGFEGMPPPPLIPRFWSPGWNSPQAVDKYQAEVGGPLAGGNPGVRLLRPAHGGRLTYSGEVPEAFGARKGLFLVVPLYHIFGSEETSVLSPEIQEVSETPYLALGPEDAGVVGIAKEGDEVELIVNGFALVLPVKFVPEIRHGVAGFPVGLPGAAGWVSLPLWAEIRKA
ncbi:MAG: NADH-quinone oxidoreductase subunit NuoG [Nitrospirota bacterium]|jgi:NADH-quinone oxidoreductase subunit G